MMLNLVFIAMAATPPSSSLWLDRHRAAEGPYVEVWTNKDSDDLLQRGEQVRVYFRSSESAYVTVFRIDTDGRVRVIYPVEPWEDNFARAQQRYEVRSYGDRHAFVVDDAPGEGYVFAVASRDPFNYGALVRGDHWDYRVIADGGRVTGDPYVALTDLVDRIIPANYSEYSYDVLPYFVEQHYQYPRFLCYDCHGYASYSYWNPYDYSCFRFRVVIYDDFYYYPYRRYAGSRVIYRTSPRLAPRYVFKDRGPSEAFVTTVKERPVDRSGRRLVDPGVTSRDLGGSGRVPTPINTPRGLPRTAADGLVGGTSGTVGTGRRGVDPVQGGSSITRQADPASGGSVADPRRRPDREPESGSGGAGPQSDNRRPESITPPVRNGETERSQPQLQRRDPNREPETQPETRDRPQPEPARENPRREEPRREQPRNGVYQPSGGQERPRVARPQETEQAQPRAEPRGESRPQAEPKAEPERRAEPRSEPRHAPENKPKEPDEAKGRRSN